MKNLDAQFGWSVITINIDDPNYTGYNLVDIFTYMSSLKIEPVKKQYYQYWIPGNGNDFLDVHKFHILTLLQLLLTIHYYLLGFIFR